MELRLIVPKARDILTKYHPTMLVLNALNLRNVPESDLYKFSNPYNRKWKISKLLNTFYVVHPRRDNVLIEAKDYVRCIFEEQVDAIISHCASNAKIKYISIERTKKVDVSISVNIENKETEGKYKHSSRTSYLIEHNLDEFIHVHENPNQDWMDEFPDVKNFVAKFNSGESKLVAEYDYKSNLTVVAAKLFQFNIDDFSAGNKLIITIRS